MMMMMEMVIMMVTMTVMWTVMMMMRIMMMVMRLMMMMVCSAGFETGVDRISFKDKKVFIYASKSRY